MNHLTSTAKARATHGSRMFALPDTVLLRRKCACGQHTVGGGECKECKKNRLQRKSRESESVRGGQSADHAHNPLSAPPIVHEVLRSPGQPLDAETRAFMEPRFGHDFSRLRIHTNSKAAESARAMNALAYTVGRDVVFAESQYAPRTGRGQRLIAHEFTHALQQEMGSYANQDLIVGPQKSDFESEADKVAGIILERKQVLQPPSPLGELGSRRSFLAVQRYGCENRGWPDQCAAPGGCDAGRQCIAMVDWSTCTCWETSEAEHRVRNLVPQWLLEVLGAAALAALIACFATGICEIGAVVVGLGVSAAAILVAIMKAAGIEDRKPIAGNVGQPEKGQDGFEDAKG